MVEETREQADANLAEATKLLASKTGAVQQAIADFVAARQNTAIDDQGLLELGGKLAEAKAATAKAQRAVDAAKYALLVFKLQETAAEASDLVDGPRKAWVEAVKRIGIVSIQRTLKREGATDEVLARAHDAVLQAQADVALLTACRRVAWDKLAELGRDAIHAGVTPPAEGSKDGPTIELNALIAGGSKRTPRAAGAGRQKYTFGPACLGSREYAETHATAEALAGYHESLRRGRPVNWTHLAVATAKRLGDVIETVS